VRGICSVVRLRLRTDLRFVIILKHKTILREDLVCFFGDPVGNIHTYSCFFVDLPTLITSESVKLELRLRLRITNQRFLTKRT
jgi:hypothetical protein